MKSIVRKMLRSSGYGVWRVNSYEFVNFYNFLYSIHNNSEGLSYLQIGAHDGILVDPMYDFVLKHPNTVRGILIEPIPSVFEKLKTNYSNFPYIVPLNLAIHNSKRSATMYKVKESVLPKKHKFASGWASLDSMHWKRMDGIVESDIEEIVVNCMTVAEVLSKYEFGCPDVLVIDTEGYDYEILQDIDLSAIRPILIRFEHGLSTKTMSSNELDQLINKFNSHGYQVILEQNDATALDTNFALNIFS